MEISDRAYGQVEYHPRTDRWVVVGYIKGKGSNLKEVEVGYASTKETAYLILSDWFAGTPK